MGRAAARMRPAGFPVRDRIVALRDGQPHLELRAREGRQEVLEVHPVLLFVHRTSRVWPSGHEAIRFTEIGLAQT